MSDGARRLRDALGQDPPAGAARLDEERLTRLAELVEHAIARQGTELDTAIEGGLGHVPRPLRRAVKKALF